MRWKQARLAGLALILAGSGAGCSGAPPILGLPSPNETGTSTDASATDAGKPPSPLQAMLMPQDIVVGTSTEVYTRIARGVLTCWFGADGPLKSGYIYHAEAEPASRGGLSEIKIMTRDAEAQDPRALRAYRVAISPSGDKTKVEIENVRLPEPLAKRLKTDVERWSADEPGCGEGPVTAGWAAEQVNEPPKAARKAKKDKKP